MQANLVRNYKVALRVLEHAKERFKFSMEIVKTGLDLHMHVQATAILPGLLLFMKMRFVSFCLTLALHSDIHMAHGNLQLSKV